jgi:positive regulator of sigma E activity
LESSISTNGCMSATGVVVGVARPGRVEIEFTTPPACRGCEGLCLWRRLPKARRATFAAHSSLAVGEHVVVTVPPYSLMAGVLVVYGVPLAALLLGALAGMALTGSDAVAAASAVLAVLAVLLAAPVLRRGVERLTLRSIDIRPAGDDNAHAHPL